MEVILGLLNITLFIALVVGLVKPALILRWTSKPTRLKVIGYWILSIIITSVLAVMVIDTKIDSKTVIQTGKLEIEEGSYLDAISTLEVIEKTDSLYSNAQSLIKTADSLNNLTPEQKRVAKKIILEEAKKEETLKLKEQLKRELKSINNRIKFADGNTIEELQMDIIVFATWATIIKEAKESENAEVIKLGVKLKSKVSKIQTKEFPNLRKKYAKIVAQIMWESDIDVSVNGTGKKYINFAGGIFATNKNKKDFQIKLQEVLEMFRFNQARYRWYKGEREYTYYTIFKGKDSEPVIL